MPRKYSRKRYSNKGQAKARRWLNYMISKGRLGPYEISNEQRMGLFGANWQQQLMGRPPQTLHQKMLRRAIGYKGEGDYDFSGNQFGLINMGSGAAAHLTGMGSYAPDAAVTNQIIGGTGQPGGITVNASDDLTGDVWMSHREFIGPVYAKAPASAPFTTSTFFTQTFPINAAMERTFPFLAQVASNFDMYDFKGLMFNYVPQYSESGDQNVLGKVMMVTQYDPEQAPFSSSVILQNYDYANSCKPSVPQVHGVETARRQAAIEMYYTRTGASSKDLRWTDLGNFTIATEAIPMGASAVANQQIPIGELWVTYRVKLSRAKIGTGLSVSNNFDTISNSGLQIGTGTAWPAGTELKGANNTGIWTITGVSNAAGVLTLRCTADPSINYGTYYINVYYETPTAADPNVVVTTTNALGITGFQQKTRLTTANVLNGTRVTTANNHLLSTVVRLNSLTGISSSFDIVFTGAGSAGAYLKFVFSQIPDNRTLDISVV
nr:MAG: capsid protein [Chemarfal virus 47]